MIRYLILVLALLLVAIRPAPAQQGNLPKPVQSLPAYPPVRCVTVDWTVESCEWRQVQAAVEGVEAVAKAWAKAQAQSMGAYKEANHTLPWPDQKLRIYSEPCWSAASSKCSWEARRAAILRANGYSNGKKRR
jgi:hypothetical protein